MFQGYKMTRGAHFTAHFSQVDINPHSPSPGRTNHWDRQSSQVSIFHFYHFEANICGKGLIDAESVHTLQPSVNTSSFLTSSWIEELLPVFYGSEVFFCIWKLP